MSQRAANHAVWQLRITEGDGEAGITDREQWQETIDYIMDMIRQQQGKSSGTRRIMKRNLSGKRRKAAYSTAAFVVGWY